MSSHVPSRPLTSHPINTTHTTQVVIYEREGIKPLSEAQRRVFDFVVVRSPLPLSPPCVWYTKARLE